MYYSDEMIEIATTCPFCGEDNSINVKYSDYADYLAGALAQEAFPYLLAEEREMLISGMCPNCQKKMFGI